MRTITTRYEEVSVKGTKRWKDSNGKWHQKTKKFWQTISPFNLKDGRSKDYSEILREVIVERDEWLKEKP
jgi:nitroimidazol reductase NimA-like FMN-containing flavoprotein (pyridoxamine 5'-phosphate oxidase superfamily)